MDDQLRPPLDLDGVPAQYYADWLDQLYRLDYRGHAAPDPVQAEAIIRYLDARPELLEESWRCWRVRLDGRGLKAASIAHARYWLDCCILGGILPASSDP